MNAFAPAAEWPFAVLHELRTQARRMALDAAAEGTVQDLASNDLRDSDLTERGGFLTNRAGVVDGGWAYDLIPNCVTGPSEAIAMYGFAALATYPIWAELELTDAVGGEGSRVFEGLNLRSLYGPAYLFAERRDGGSTLPRASHIGYFGPVVFGPNSRIVINVRALRNMDADGGAFTLLGFVADTRQHRIARFASRSRGDTA